VSSSTPVEGTDSLGVLVKKKAVACMVLLACWMPYTSTPDCKLKFSVVYNDGKNMQVA